MTTPPLLSDRHRQKLFEASAIQEAVATERGYCTLWDTASILARGFAASQATQVPALGIPLWDTTGRQHLWQIRPDTPRPDDRGKPIKYETPYGAIIGLDCHPRVQPQLADPRIPLWVTEGVCKEDALVSRGACVIGLMGGVWGYQKTDASTHVRTLLPDWTPIALAGREIRIAFDSDLATNPHVRQAQEAFLALLWAADAIPSAVVWPDAYLTQKWGADDFLAAGHTLADLEAMLVTPEPPLNAARLLAQLEALPAADRLTVLLEHMPTIATWDGVTWMGLKPKLKMRIPDLNLNDLACAWKEAHQAYLRRQRAEADDGQPSQSTLARDLALTWKETVLYDERAETWYHYLDGLWRVLPSPTLFGKLQTYLDAEAPGYAWHTVHGVERLLHGRLAQRLADEQPGWLPFRNGVLDLKAMTLHPHSPTRAFRWCLPYAYDPDATCPTTVEWLHEAVGGDHGQVQVLRAFMKALLTRRVDLERYLENIGPAGTGKSTFMRLLMALAGRENVFITELKYLESNRFETSGLRHKLLMLVTDAERYSGPVNQLKAITGRDEIRMEEKFKAIANDFAPVLVCVSANEPIQSADYTSGLTRRRLSISFQHRPQTIRDLLEWDAHHWRGELAAEIPGVINWVLSMPDAAMTDVVRHTERTVPTLQTLARKAIVDTNALAEWANTHLVLDPGTDAHGNRPFVNVGVARRVLQGRGYEREGEWLYPNYRSYCETVNAGPTSMKRFTHLLQDLLVNQLRLPVVHGQNGHIGSHFSGMRLRTPQESTQPLLFYNPPPLPPVHGGGSGMAAGMAQTYVVSTQGCEGCQKFLAALYRGDTLPPDDPLVPKGVGGSLYTECENAKIHPNPPPSSNDAGFSGPDTSTAPLPSHPAGGDAPVFDLPPYHYITTEAQLTEVLPRLLACPTLGLDTETTGLTYDTDRIRLVQLATPTEVLLIDAFTCPLEPLRPLLESPTEFLTHNGKFDGRMLDAAGLPWPSHMYDTMIAARLLGAGKIRPKMQGKGEKEAHEGWYSLKAVVQRYLGLTLDKTHQKGEWDRPVLTEEQLHYAALDAAILFPLKEVLDREMAQAGMLAIAALEHQLVPALIWMESAGLGLDIPPWLALSEEARGPLADLDAHLHQLVRDSGYEKPVELDKKGRVKKGWTPEINWNAPATQVLPFFQWRGHALTSTSKDVLKMLKTDDPVIPLFLARKKLVETLRRGPEWVAKHVRDGRLYPDFRQCGTTSGRMSCAEPNLQNIPRTRAYRQCFRAREGCVLIKGDYGQIELRMAALLAGESVMLEAFQRQEDLHRKTAAAVRGVAPHEVSPEQRNIAKTVNFGLIYGLQPAALQRQVKDEGDIDITVEEAEAFYGAFFQEYPQIQAWHERLATEIAQAQGAYETRTLKGRRRLGIWKVNDAANTPTQGSAADGCKLAMVRLYNRRHEMPGVRMINQIHDEILLEAPVEMAEQAAAWLKTNMVEAMRWVVDDKVPIEVEITIWPDWAGPEKKKSADPAPDDTSSQ